MNTSLEQNNYNIKKKTVNEVEEVRSHYFNVDSHIHEYTSLILYIVVFGVIIPLILVKNKKYEILAAYFPNLDLIANILNFNNLHFKNLYKIDPDSLSTAISEMSINYLALTGVGFLIAKEAYDTKSVYNGFTIGTFMFFITYLSPSLYLQQIMHHSADYGLDNTMSTIVGIFIVLALIAFEAEMIKLFKKPFSSFYKKLFKSL